MIFHLAVGVCAALTDARVYAVSIMASLAETAFYVIGTFASATVGEWIAAVSGRARADGSSTQCLLTDGVGTAWIAGTTLSCRWKKFY